MDYIENENEAKIEIAKEVLTFPSLNNKAVYTFKRYEIDALNYVNTINIINALKEKGVDYHLRGKNATNIVVNADCEQVLDNVVSELRKNNKIKFLGKNSNSLFSGNHHNNYWNIATQLFDDNKKYTKAFSGLFFLKGIMSYVAATFEVIKSSNKTFNNVFFSFSSRIKYNNLIEDYKNHRRNRINDFIKNIKNTDEGIVYSEQNKEGLFKVGAVLFVRPDIYNNAANSPEVFEINTSNYYYTSLVMEELKNNGIEFIVGNKDAKSVIVNSLDSERVQDIVLKLCEEGKIKVHSEEEFSLLLGSECKYNWLYLGRASYNALMNFPIINKLANPLAKFLYEKRQQFRYKDIYENYKNTPLDTLFSSKKVDKNESIQNAPYKCTNKDYVCSDSQSIKEKYKENNEKDINISVNNTKNYKKKLEKAM